LDEQIENLLKMAEIAPIKYRMKLLKEISLITSQQAKLIIRVIHLERYLYKLLLKNPPPPPKQ